MQTASASLVDHLGDTDLATLASQGDARAFEQIMRRHNRLLFRTARSILKRDADAEDALQDAYLRAWQALPGFRAEARLSTWLVRIVANEALGRLRRVSARVVPLMPGLPDDAGDKEDATMEQGDDRPESQPEHAVLRAQVRRLIEDRIDLLPDVFRTVFMLRAVEEMSVEDVAGALDIPEATVRSRFFRARALLRDSLAREVDLGIEEAFGFDGERCNRIVAGVLARLPAQPKDS